MIDADHRLEKNTLESLLNELNKYSFDIGQSQLKSYENLSWLNRAEEEQWNLTHKYFRNKKNDWCCTSNIQKKYF